MVAAGRLLLGVAPGTPADGDGMTQPVNARSKKMLTVQ
jgi:hypothetical protein